LYRWLFIQEPDRNGKVIGVPVIRNSSNNGGIDTGTVTGIVNVLGGASQGRITSRVPVAIPDSNGNQVSITHLRTVLVNSVTDAFADVARLVPGFRLDIAGARSPRIPTPDRPNRVRTHNHPNGVAIDTNYRTPIVYPRQNWNNHPRIHEPGINSVLEFQYLNSADVVNVMEQHGWRFGYGNENPGFSTDGFMHWSISRS